ncbi:ubiquinol-cytochrome c reductase iron-sulfur subunit [Bacteroidota bacterium]
MNLQRREFLNSLLGLGGLGALGAIFYPVISFLVPPKSAEPKVNSVKAGIASEFESNSAEIIKFGKKPVILIKKETGEFCAFAATCTHLDCIVQYREDSKQILCACHNGIYDLKGRNVSGPPPKPLEEFEVKIINDEIIITTQAG